MSVQNPTVNPDREPNITLVGNEKTPIGVIDDFLVSLEPLRLAALHGKAFKTPPGAYPGKIAPLLPRHIQTLGNTIVPFMQQLYAVPKHFLPQLGTTYYGLASTAPADLDPVQCIPHVDTYDELNFVALLYLNEGDFQGTAFYQHTQSGFERIGQARAAVHKKIMADQRAKRGLITPGYYKNDGDFKEIFRVTHQPNRLAIYPGSLLHAPLVDNPESLTDSVEHGRLAALLYFRFVNPANAQT